MTRAVPGCFHNNSRLANNIGNIVLNVKVIFDDRVNFFSTEASSVGFSVTGDFAAVKESIYT